MLTAWFFERMSMEKCSWLRSQEVRPQQHRCKQKTQCTKMQRQFVVLSFKVKFGRLAFQKKKKTKQTVNGSWVPQFFSAQIEILQKN